MGGIIGGSNTEEVYEDLKAGFKVMPKWKMVLMMRALSAARKEKYVKSKELKYEGIPRIFTPVQFNAFFRVISNPNHMFCFRLMYYLGLRVHEVGMIRVSDCLFESRRVRIRSNKTDRCDYLPLVEPVVSLVSHRIMSLNLGRNERLAGYSPDMLRNKFSRYREKAGLDEYYSDSADGRRLYIFSSHVLRATAITEFYRHTKDPVKTMKFARHRSFSSTMVYIRFVDEELSGEMERIFS